MLHIENQKYKQVPFPSLGGVCNSADFVLQFVIAIIS